MSAQGTGPMQAAALAQEHQGQRQEASPMLTEFGYHGVFSVWLEGRMEAEQGGGKVSLSSGVAWGAGELFGPRLGQSLTPVTGLCRPVWAAVDVSNLHLLFSGTYCGTLVALTAPGAYCGVNVPLPLGKLQLPPALSRMQHRPRRPACSCPS